MNKTQMKKAAVILGTVAIGTVIFNSLANRIMAVDRAREVIRNGV